MLPGPGPYPEQHHQWPQYRHLPRPWCQQMVASEESHQDTMEGLDRKDFFKHKGVSEKSLSGNRAFMET